jgi:hypothetical protein
MMVMMRWVSASMVMLLIRIRIEASNYLNCLIIGSIQRLEDIDELVEVIRPSLLE